MASVRKALRAFRKLAGSASQDLPEDPEVLGPFQKAMDGYAQRLQADLAGAGVRVLPLPRSLIKSCSPER